MKSKVLQRVLLVLLGLALIVFFLSVAIPALAAGQAQEEPPTLKDMFIGGVNVLGLIIILVQIGKDWFGLQGNALRAVSLALGLLFAVLWQTTIGWPSDVAGWIPCIVRLLYGVLASGIVDFTRDIASRAGTKAVAEIAKRVQAASR